MSFWDLDLDEDVPLTNGGANYDGVDEFSFDDNEFQSPSLVMPSPPFKKPHVQQRPRMPANQPSWEDDPIEEFPAEPAYSQPDPYPTRQTQSQPKPKNCIEVTRVPPVFQPIFPYDYFNLIQSECWSTLYESDDNCVIGAPTGSGKTVCFELAMVRLFQKQVRDNNFDARPQGKQKIIYLAPIKALCQERLDDWQKKFGPLGIKCVELTGDSENINSQTLVSADVILTTPEKWDSITRKWKEIKFLVGQVALLLIDEVHLLHEDRGATLEAVVSRMKTISSSSLMANTSSARLRFIALSASVPNIDDIAVWLNVSKSATKKFSDEWRPVKLDIRVIGYPESKNAYLFDRNLNFRLFEVISQYSDGRPSLVFCSSRKGTSVAATSLGKDLSVRGNPFIKDREHTRRLLDASRRTSDKTLADCITKGLAYHNAGMDIANRKLVEELFLKEDIQVLFSTSSLAQGVNLPAHLVVIKSTEQWMSGQGFAEYNPISVHQMVGRAGRPQFDTFARAVIMTKMENKLKYETLLFGKQVIESNLHKRMIEHFNAEIALETLTSVEGAIEWLKSTYLFVRIKKNPTHYNLPRNLTDEVLEKKLEEMCTNCLHELRDAGMIEMNGPGDIKATEIGKSMAKFCIHFDTMKVFAEITPTADVKELLYILSHASELSDCVLRRGEKKVLNTLNGKTRFPLEGKFVHKAMKVNCLFQAILGDVPIEEYSLKQETFALLSSAIRVVACMTQYLIEKKFFIATHNAIVLGKCLKQRMWEDSPYIAKQLDKIGPAYANSLVSGGITTLEKLVQVDPRTIERLVGRNPPFGNEVKEGLLIIPRFDVTVAIDANQEAVIRLNRVSETPRKSKLPQNFIDVVVGIGEDLIFYKKIMSWAQTAWEFRVALPQSNNTAQHCSVLLLNTEYLGADVVKTVNVNPKYQQVARVNQPKNRAEPKATQVTGSSSEIKYAERLSTANMTRQPILNVQGPHNASGDINDNGQNGTYLDHDDNQNLILRYGQCLHPCRDKGECKHPCCKYGIKNNRRKADESGLDDDERQNKRQKTAAEQSNNSYEPGMKSPSGAAPDYLQTLRAKATNLSTNGNIKLLKGENSAKEVVPVKVPSYLQSFAWQKEPSPINKPITLVNAKAANAMPTVANSTPRVEIPAVKMQPRTFRFLGKEIALPSETPERSFFAPSRFINIQNNTAASNTKNEFEFEL